MPPATRRSGGRGYAHPDAYEQGSCAPPYDSLLAYEAILGDSRLNITIYDRDFVVRDVSRTAAELIHLTREAMIGASLLEVLPPEYRTNMERVLAGETLEVEVQLAPEFCSEEPWTRMCMLPIRDHDGVVHGGVTIVVDVTGQRRAEELIEKLAFIDPLTALPNRRMIAMMLDRALSGAKAGKRQLALVWLNIDRFKDVNSTLGRDAGDKVLRAVGARLTECVRTNDTVARIDDDDFLLLLPRISSRTHLDRLVGRIQAAFTTPFIVGKEPILLSASCGVAVHPNGGSVAHELEELAHAAMRAAKDLGGGACEVYEEGCAEADPYRLRLVGEIKDGIEQGHFVLHYQPQLDLESMRVQAVEALVRWQHPERGLLAPGEFIAFAEETAMIVPLGRHILERACDDYRGWRESLEAPPRLAVNVSAREFQRTDVCRQVREVAEAASIAPSALEIEITETAMLADPGHAAEVAACLREAGATIALDDFGTGYSSLTHLRELAIDRVKIDQTFVGSCLTDRSAAAILVAVTHLAHELGMEVVAEGVETAEQLNFLRAVGCDAAQGYHLARPLPRDECTEFLLQAAGPVM